MSTSPKPAPERIAPVDADCNSLGASEFTVADILALLVQRLREQAFGWLHRTRRPPIGGAFKSS